ncbi:STAS domain-containing protein [Curvivirga sp.]|uniref:STAS domain-containing protein n=1 Tax=Curvivirga sp. TaxID=2856848 RepID=UPI003B5B10E9
MEGTQISISETECDISLPTILDLGQTENLIDNLAQAIDKNLDVRIHAGQVERLTTAPCQALLAAARSVESGKASFEISNYSEAFKSGLEDLGLWSVFSKWSKA